MVEFLPFGSSPIPQFHSVTFSVPVSKLFRIDYFFLLPPSLLLHPLTPHHVAIGPVLFSALLVLYSLPALAQTPGQPFFSDLPTSPVSWLHDITGQHSPHS